ATGQIALDAIPWGEEDADLRGLQLPVLENGRLQLKARDVACRYLDDQKRCRIHMKLGNPIFTPCTAFPYRFTETPDGIAVTTSFMCGSVRANVGPPLAERADDIYMRFAKGGVSAKPESFRLALGREVPWEQFKQAEAALRAPLGRSELGLDRRLWLGSRAVLAASEGQAADPGWETEAIKPLPADTLEETLDVRDGILRFFALVDPMLAPLKNPAAALVSGDEARLARFLETIHFSKVFSYGYSLAASNAIGLLLVRAIRILTAHHGGTLPEPVWERLGSFVFHGAFNTALDTIFEVYPTTPGALGRPTFALDLLRAEA
ncbi:MAG: hypothetical protein JWM80_2308, partial [Cyanobacteria bacterium RYN_339]|nr:hypothetical protein [Cyanobacteria bacterium RYN_339]